MFYHEKMTLDEQIIVYRKYRPKSGIGFIYTLRDGFEGEIKYVGKTVDFHQRLIAHRNCKYAPESFKNWQSNLTHFIVMDIIEVVPITEILVVEESYINKFKANGCSLLNIKSAKKNEKRRTY